MLTQAASSTIARTARRLPQQMLSGVMFCTAGALLIAALSESALVGMFELPGRALSGSLQSDDSGIAETTRDL
jgi:hypothetical protein